MFLHFLKVDVNLLTRCYHANVILRPLRFETFQEYKSMYYVLLLDSTSYVMSDLRKKETCCMHEYNKQLQWYNERVVDSLDRVSTYYQL